jgi:SulP family sulfate permease
VAIVFFYAFFYFKGLSIADLMADNLLLGTFQSGSLWYPPQYFYNQIDVLFDWSIITSQIGIIATIPLVSFIGGLLMVSAIEFSTDSELEPNFELKVMGISNMMSGFLGGGFVGYPSTTFTVMQRSLHSATRLAGILSALVPMIVLIFGASFLGFIPRFVVGGLLIYFGYQFIDYWVIKALRHSTLSDMNIIAAIVITSLWLGFVAAVGVGMFAAVGFFLFKYSKTSVIRYISTGALLRSSVTRNATHDDWLTTHADKVVIFGLQGYIFFGTAYNLHEEIMARANNTQLDAIILDFRHVTGIDTSVIQSFHKLYLQLVRKNSTLLFAHLPPQYRGLMRKKGLIKATEQGFAEFGNLDEALEWQENHLLKNSDLPIYQVRPMFSVLAEQLKDAVKAAILLQYLEQLNVLAGTKIIEQNTLANELFFIESGRLSAYLVQANRPPLRLQTMIDDTIIGEIGFYLGQLRTAMVIAEEPSVIYRLSKDALAQLEIEHPNVAMALHKLLVEKTAKRVNHVSNSLKRFL